MAGVTDRSGSPSLTRRSIELTDNDGVNTTAADRSSSGSSKYVLLSVGAKIVGVLLISGVLSVPRSSISGRYNVGAASSNEGLIVTIPTVIVGLNIVGDASNSGGLIVKTPAETVGAWIVGDASNSTGESDTPPVVMVGA